jgi:uncharacterized protein YndB with AHSA1/START domain
LHEVHVRWIKKVRAQKTRRIARFLRNDWKEMTMTKPDFMNVTYIATTPEKAWESLVDPKVMRQYWLGAKADSPAHENISDSKAGSRREHRRVDTGAVDMAGMVVEHTPARRLAFAWASPNDFEDETKAVRPGGCPIAQWPRMEAGYPNDLGNRRALIRTSHESRLTCHSETV